MAVVEDRPRGRVVALEAALLTLALALFYLTQAAAAARAPGFLYDDAVYLALGRALAEGDGYRSLYLVGEPAHVKFPPALPALHAVLWMAAGSLDRVARLAVLLNVLASAACLALGWWLGRRALGLRRWSAGLFVAGPLFLGVSRHYLVGATSEPWYLLEWLLALTLAGGVAVATTAAARWRRAFLLGVVLGLAVLTRSQGIALVLAVPAALMLDRRARAAAFGCLLVALVPVVGWGIWTATVLAREGLAAAPDQRPYLLSFGGARELLAHMPLVVADIVPRYARIAAGMVPALGTGAGVVVVAGYAALAVVGARPLARVPGLGAAAIGSVLASIAVLMLWLFAQDRFLVTLLPVTGLAAAAGAQTLVAHLRARQPAVLASTAGVAGAVGALAVADGVREQPDSVSLGYAERRAAFTALLEQRTTWVLERTTPADRIITDQGQALWMRTGRRTMIANPEEPAVGPSVLAVPGRYLADRIIADGATIAIDWTGGPRGLGTSLRLLRRRCPRAIRSLGTSLPVRHFGALTYWSLRADECVWRARSGG